jgi:acyl-CoA synthetase (AMP-forming)/AMP-acid ligase II
MFNVPDDFRTVADAFSAVVRDHPGKECIRIPRRPERHYLPDGLSLTYAQVGEIAEELRARYRAAGYGHGHRIAILLENRPEFFFHWLALNALGVSVAPVNPDYRPHEIHFILERSEAVLAVTLRQRVSDFGEAVAKLPRPIPVVALDDFARPLPKAVVPPLNSPPGRRTESGLLFTSGTTGMPKGCMLDNEAFFFNGARFISAGGVMTIEHGEERLYNPLPLYYANAFAITNVAMILAAGCMIFPDRFHPRSYWREVVETDATIVHHLGIIPPLLLQQDPVPEERMHRIKFSGGAGVDPEQHALLEERFGFPFVEYFGMSEVGICSATNVEPRKIDTRACGRPWPGVEFRLVDEHDHDVPVGALGQLLIRRAGLDPKLGLCAGYLKDPETTAEVWRDGWFHTGDILRRDEDGLYYFVDRIKHMIRRSGQNIAAAEIEAVLRLHPAVQEAAALPAPDEMRQEEVLACIVPAPGHAPDRATAESIMDWSLRHLAYFKAPGWLLFMDKLPTTSTQKLQKSSIFAKGEDPRTRSGIIDLRERKKRQA